MTAPGARRWMWSFGLFLLCGAAFAGPVEDAADAVVKAVADGTGVKELSASDQPDPWRVVDELCRRAAFDAADAFARAAPRPDTKGLPAYVAAQRTRVRDPDARTAHAASNRALGAGQMKRALAIVDAAKPDGNDVVSIRLLHARAIALDRLRRPEATSAYRAAADAAVRLGWLARATDLMRMEGTTARARFDRDGAREAWERCLALARRRGNRKFAAQVLAGLAMLHHQAGDYPRALESYQRSLEELRAVGDRYGAAQTLGNLGLIYDDTGDFARALECHREALKEKRALGDRVGAAATLANIGLAYRSTGDYALALKTLRLVLAENLALNRPLEAAQARINLGSIHRLTGDYVRALTLLEAALQVMRVHGNKRGVAAILVNLGNVYLAKGNYVRALDFHRRALKARTALNDRAGVAGTLSDLGTVHLYTGDAVRALDCYERAFEASRALGDPRRAANALRGIGGVHRRAGDHARALEVYARALKQQEAIGDRPGMADTLGEIGNVHDATSEFTLAIEYLRRAHKLREAIGARRQAELTLLRIGQVHAHSGDYASALAAYRRLHEQQELQKNGGGAARSLLGIGLIHRATGDYARALDICRRALRGMQAAGNPAGRALALSTLGSVYLVTGDFARALDCYQRALEEKRALGNRVGAAGTLSEIAMVYDSTGDHARALKTYQRALDEQRAIGNRHGEATVLANMAGTYWTTGDHARALDGFKRAVASQEALGMRDAASIARGNIGSVYKTMGDHARALEFMRRALAEQIDLGLRAVAAKTLGNIGAVQFEKGDYAQALETYRRALQQKEMAGDRPGAARTLGNIGTAHLRMGQPAPAQRAARKAVARLQFMTGGLADEEGASLRGTFAHLFDVGLEASARLDDAAGGAFFLESGRAAMLLEGLGGRERIRDAAIPAELRALEARARATESGALARYRRRLATGKRAVALFKEVKQAREGIVAIARRIQRHAKSRAGLVYPQAKSVEVLQAGLRPDEALILYSLTKRECVALVIEPDRARIVELPEAAGIEAAAEALAQVAATRPGASRAPSKSAGALAKRLAKLVIEPLGLGPKAKRLLVSPAGRLSYLPFALLTDREVVHVPSGTTHWFLRDERPETPGTKVLALGDPDYTSKRRPKALQPLPASGEEAAAIGDVVLRGKQATIAGLRENLGTQPRWRAVHLACHGLIDPRQPVLSSLALSAGKSDDGLLRCLDVLRMKIPADLVVLSACETGKGKVYEAEGVIGFTRAFMFAGSPRVLVSLWKVDDEATKELMVAFYELWKTHPTATALRKAQELIRAQERWKHPYYWAAWQLWGLGD